MARARPNPIGLDLHGTTLVRLGKGEHSHILNADTGLTLCESGAGRAKQLQPLYRSDAKSATCYRCVKLARMNVEAGRMPWQGPGLD